MTENRKRLSLRQERFVCEYIATGVATEAARLAGYANPNMHSSRMMTNDSIVAAINEKRAVLMDDVEAKIARYVDALEREAQSADNSDSSRIRSLELLLKVAGGFAPEKTEVSTYSGGFLADLDLNEASTSPPLSGIDSGSNDLH